MEPGLGSEFLAAFHLQLPAGFGATWFGITLWQYLLALVWIMLALFARRAAALVLNRFVLSWISRLGGVYAGKIIGELIKPATALVGLFGVFVAVRVLLLPVGGGPGFPAAVEFVNQSFQVAVAAVVLWALVRLVNVLGLYLQERAEEKELPVEVPVIALLQKSLQFLVIVLGGLLLIQHMGYPVASLLGGLGIGGLAVALAAQDTLSNIFGSVIVFTDKPFKVGDWVQIGKVEGIVEAIGFRSTRIRTWGKSLITLPNKTIANSEIENWSAMPIRRITYTLTVSYETPADKLEALVEGIRRLVRRHPGIDQGYFLVSFTGFGEHGLEIFLYCFTRSTDWTEHMQVRQELNLDIMRLMEALGVSVALPSRRIYLGPGGSRQEAVSAADPDFSDL